MNRASRAEHGVDQEQPEKSRRLAVVVAPAVTLSGWLVLSFVVVREDGVQMGEPP